ncbi:MAG TPA: hypothetical protein VJ454_13585 [Steroidobacteraceae bacterium]|nr:hypothetical protein [Steroidobacteraceae bacterium]
MPPADLVHELGEVAGGVEVAIEHEAALIAPVGPFGQAQLGFHHATGRTGRGGRVPAVRDVHGGGGPAGFVLDLASEFAPAPAMRRASRGLRSIPATCRVSSTIVP